MKPTYKIDTQTDTLKFSEYLASHGEHLLPMVGLIGAARIAMQEVIEVQGRASIEAVLQLSARGVAGAKQQAKQGGRLQRVGAGRGSKERGAGNPSHQSPIFPRRFCRTTTLQRPRGKGETCRGTAQGGFDLVEESSGKTRPHRYSSMARGFSSMRARVSMNCAATTPSTTR